jgi:hypothetical protein
MNGYWFGAMYQLQNWGEGNVGWGRDFDISAEASL